MADRACDQLPRSTAVPVSWLELPGRAASPQAREKYKTYWSARVRNMELICSGVVVAAAHMASRVLACAKGNSREALRVMLARGVTLTNAPGRRHDCVSTSCRDRASTPAVLHWPRAATVATVCADAVDAPSTTASTSDRCTRR
jgi:hypothetical protein